MTAAIPDTIAENTNTIGISGDDHQGFALTEPKMKPTYPCRRNAEGIPISVMKYPSRSSMCSERSLILLEPRVRTPDQPGTVPQQRPELAHFQRAIHASGSRSARSSCARIAAPALVVLQLRRGDRLAPQRVHQVRLETVIVQQLHQPAPAVSRLERRRRARP